MVPFYGMIPLTIKIDLLPAINLILQTQRLVS